MARATRYSWTAWAGAAMLAAGLGACTLDVPAPSQVAADELDFPANANLIVSSVQADFECALAHYISTTSLFGNEFLIAGFFSNQKEVDKRTVFPSNSSYTSVTCSSGVELIGGLYKPLATARWQADNALKLLEGWTDAEVADRQQLIATSAAYAGYSLVLLGESMCSAAIDVGPELSPAQLFQEAEQRFTKGLAAAQSVGSSDLRNWNLVGRARARLRQSKLAEASTDAQQVPISFVKTATYSADSPRRENLVWVHGQRSRWITVDPSYRGLTFGGMPDPRVPVLDANAVGHNGTSPLWITTKYSSNAAPIPFATGVEARLIVAEAAGGQVAVGIINELHDRVGLPPFASSDPTEIRDQILEERKREFFVDGHHLGDLRQYSIPFTPAPGTPFIDLGGVYGDQTCFPLPDIERANNPNIP